MKKVRIKKKWKIIFFIIIFIVLLIASLKLGTKGLKVREYKITNENLSSFYGLKIVHFSDLLLDKSSEKKLDKLVNMINNTKPDIVFFSGDLISKSYKLTEDSINMITSYLKKINYTYGKYYVNGDTDKYNISYETIMKNSDFISINNNYEIIYSKDNNSIFITGLDIDKSLNSEIIEKLNLENYNYKICILHYPDEIENILKYNFNLILSGHSLNGQIRLPIIGKIYSPNHSKKYYDSYYKIENTNIFISNGIGNNKINMRLFNTPSFNLYRLVDK